MVRSGISEGADAVSGEVNQSLTREQLPAMFGGLDDLRAAEPGGIGGRWPHLSATISLPFAGIAVIRGRVRRDPDSNQ